MNAPNPIDLIFADMDKLSPGDDTLTLHVLRSRPHDKIALGNVFGVIENPDLKFSSAQTSLALHCDDRIHPRGAPCWKKRRTN